MPGNATLTSAAPLAEDLLPCERAHSRTEAEAKLEGAVHPLVRELPEAGRRSLYLASHASRIVDWQLPEGRLLLRDLMEHGTRDAFTYTHSWQVGDLVIWDERATMHRGLAYDDTKYKRELRRVTTLDLPRAMPVMEPMLAIATT